MNTDLTHQHLTPTGYVTNAVPGCCADAFARERRNDERRHDEDLRAERHRMVTESVAALNAQTEAMTLLLGDADALLVRKVSAAAVRAIRDVACICPQIDVTRLGQRGPETMRGLDPLCGIHGKDRT